MRLSVMILIGLIGVVVSLYLMKNNQQIKKTKKNNDRIKSELIKIGVVLLLLFIFSFFIS